MAEISVLINSIETWSIVIFVIFAVYMNIAGARKNKEGRSLFSIFIVVILILLSDVVGARFIGNTSQKGFFIHELTVILGFIFIYILQYQVFWYMMVRINSVLEQSGKKIISIVWLISASVVILSAIICLLFLGRNGFYYCFDENNNFIKADGIWLLHLFYIIIFVIYSLCVLVNRKNIGKLREYVNFIYPPLLALFIEIVHPEYRFINISIVLGCFILLVQYVIRRIRLSSENKENVNLNEEKSIQISLSDSKKVVHIFIVNPEAGGVKDVSELRKILSRISNFEYFVFTTRGQGEEGNLVRQIIQYFPNEKIRFYCCGGSGTIRNVLNGIDDFSKVEVAFYPKGLTNDYLKNFGENQAYFQDIIKLITGKVIKVDYIRTNDGVALNTLSTGIDSELVQYVEKYRNLSIFGQFVPTVLAFIKAGLLSKPKNYEVYMDDVKYEGAISEIIWGKGLCIGGAIWFADKQDIFSGEASYVVGGKNGGLESMIVFLALMSKDVKRREKYFKTGKSVKMRIRRLDNKPFMMDFDGELGQPHTEWEAEIVRKGLNLVIPREVTYHE